MWECPALIFFSLPLLENGKEKGGSFFYLQLDLFAYSLSFFAYSPLRP